MKRLLFALVGLAVVASMVTPAFALRLGTGYFHPNEPVGARLWFSDQIGGDLGIGFQSLKFPKQNSTDTATKLQFGIDVGVPIILMGSDSGDPTKFFFRPGFEFVSTPTGNFGSDKAKDIYVRGSLGVEHFISKNFSVQVAHGIAYHSHDPGITGTKKVNNFGTEAFGVSDIGFHYYFWESK